MKKYVCSICGYVYDEAKGDPDNGIAPGTKWEDLPDDFGPAPFVAQIRMFSRRNRKNGFGPFFL